MFDSTRIRGVIPAMLTPLTPDERVDEIGVRQLVRFLLERRVHGIFTLGSTGEFTALTPEQRQDVICIVVDEVGGRVPVLAGTSASGTKRTIAYTLAAHAAGADVAVVLPPYYLSCTESEVLRHFRAILNEAEIPILLYNFPAATRVRITLENVAALAEHERIVGIKDSSGDFAYFQQLIYRYRDHPRFRVVQGHEFYTGASFLLGAHACHLGLANVAPQLFVQLYEAARAARIEQVANLQQKANTLAKLWEIAGGAESSYINAMKTALHLFGVCGTAVSRPYSPFGQPEVAKVRAFLEEHGMLSAPTP